MAIRRTNAASNHDRCTHPAIIRAAIVHAIEADSHSFWRIDIAPLSITRLSGLGGRWNLSAAGCPAKQNRG
jgi:broad specificity phosphatase PhoE